jgi:hypothetical protein
MSKKLEIRNELQQTASIGVIFPLMTPSIGLPETYKVYPLLSRHYFNNTYSVRRSLISSGEIDTFTNIENIEYEPRFIKQFSTLQNFAFTLLSSTKDLDYEIAEAINSNFWDLYEPL